MTSMTPTEEVARKIYYANWAKPMPRWEELSENVKRWELNKASAVMPDIAKSTPPAPNKLAKSIYYANWLIELPNSRLSPVWENLSDNIQAWMVRQAHAALSADPRAAEGPLDG